MNIEKDWPTLVEANHVKDVKKKYNIKKRSTWVKVNAGVNFNKTESAIELVRGTNLNDKEKHVQTNNSNNVMTKEVKRLYINKNSYIKPFDIDNEDLYNYCEDTVVNTVRQKTLCKQVPSKNNISNDFTDVRVNEMYCEFLNNYLNYINSEQINPIYPESLDNYNDKVQEPDKLKIETKPVYNQIYENEIMYVRANVLSYYFSEMNLFNDKYLMSVMDDDGWVNLDILLKFPRLLKTKTTMQDVSNIVSNIKYPEFSSNGTRSILETVLQLKENEGGWKIRRSDMTKFKINLLAFSNPSTYSPIQHELPFPKYTYNYFLNNLNNIFMCSTKNSKIEDSKVCDWTEVKPKVRRSRKSESCLNENQNNVNVDKQDNLDFEFTSEPNPYQQHKSNQNIRRKQVSRKSMDRSRSRTISGGSEDELDESNIYILSMKPKMTYAKILDWADVSDSDDDDDDDNNKEISVSTNTQSKYNLSQRLLSKHPSGDRHPNPDYQPRSKIQEQLREIISDGLKDWKNNTEVIRRNRRDSSSSTSSDIKVQICQDEKTFKLMQKSFQNNDNSEGTDDPNLPTSIIPIEQKVEVMKQKSVNIMIFKPLPKEININCDFLVESSTSSVMNPVQFDSWSPPFTISDSVNQWLDKLLENVQYQYLNIGNSTTFDKTANIYQSKIDGDANADPNRIAEESRSKLAISEPAQSILINDRKEIKKPKRACKVGFYPVTKVGPAKDKLKDKTRASCNPVVEYDVGYAYSGGYFNSRRRTVSGSTYSQYNDAGYAVAHGIPIPFNDHPSQLLLQENGFEIKFYNVFRKESLADRERRGIGRSQEMNTLFRFWSFFLRENKSKRMYEEFQKYAWEDAMKGYRYGVECLFRMFTYKLEQKKHFNEQQFQDFQKNVLKDLESNHLYGLEKFWAFLKYSGKKLEVHSKIKKLLEKYKTLEDFRTNFIPPQGFHSYKIEYPQQEAVESGIESE